MKSLTLSVLLLISGDILFAQDVVLGERDPFQIPSYIQDLEKQYVENLEMDTIDDKVEAIKRWPLKEYKVLAVMWDIKEPKAMIQDGNKTVHLVKKNQRIGNREGIITTINEGEIVVKEKGIPIVIEIEKGLVEPEEAAVPNLPQNNFNNDIQFQNKGAFQNQQAPFNEIKK